MSVLPSETFCSIDSVRDPEFSDFFAFMRGGRAFQGAALSISERMEAEVAASNSHHFFGEQERPMSKKRCYRRTENGDTVLVYAFKNDDGTVNFLSQEAFETVGHPMDPNERDQAFAEMLFGSKCDEELPHLNLDARPLE